MGAAREEDDAPLDSTELQQTLQGVLGPAYTIERQLGRPGSRVFAAIETGLGRRVVVKVLPRSLAAGVSAERFRQEVRLAAHLTHPHIVPALSAGSGSGLLYYTMPFIDGESLRARLARERQLVDDALGIARDVADALSYAHGQGIVPPRHHARQHPARRRPRARHQLRHRARGHPGGYAWHDRPWHGGGDASLHVPEQAGGAPNVAMTSDIYSLGTVVFGMLAGETPFTGATPVAILEKLLTTTAPALRTRRPSTPAAVELAVARALAVVPADRFQTARDFAQALRQ